MGHNLGLVHDDANGGLLGGFHPYSKGYQQKTLIPNFFTIMAYSQGCDGCRAIQNFSNPDVLYETIPTGIPNLIDSARTLEYIRPYAEAWKGPGTPPPCTYQVAEQVGMSHMAGDTTVAVIFLKMAARSASITNALDHYFSKGVAATPW
ncbi:MAG: hypothetical protein KIT83_01830 [Bryobacterales bacterium]|nr:hypothetical protein [Bryobacterales bacterium]